MEKFYNFFRADGLGAAAITDKLTEVLMTMKIDVSGGTVAQCYDGARTMSGRLHGVQQRMRESICPKGVFIHCWAHRLNFSLLFLFVPSIVRPLPTSIIFIPSTSFSHLPSPTTSSSRYRRRCIVMLPKNVDEVYR